MSRAVIYCRVSTVQQTDNTSLETQYLLCKKKAESIGAHVVGVFSEQHSGGDYVSREGIQEALGMLERKEADILITYDMSRYSRDAEHQQQILRRVLAAGGRIVFTTFDIGDLDDPDSRLMFGVQGVFAENERLRIRRNMMRGRRASAEKGYQVTHSAPYGFEIATRDKIMAGKYKIEDHKKYFVVPHEADIALELCERLGKGESLYSITQDFNARNVPTRTGSGAWWPSTIRSIVTNEALIGKAHFGKYQTTRDESLIAKGYKTKVRLKKAPEENRVTIEIPPIVPVELWNRVQETLKTNQARIGGRVERKHMLTSLLRCPECGKRMYGRKISSSTFYANVGADEPLYACTGGHHYRTLENRCKSKVWRGSVLEPLVIDDIIEKLADPKILAIELSRQEAAAKPAKPKVSKMEMQKKLRELEKQETATVQAQIRAVQSGVNSSIYESELKRIIAEKEAVQSQLSLVAKTEAAPKIIKTQAEALCAQLVDKAEMLTNNEISPREKNLFLWQFIEYIIPREISGKPQVEIAWKVAKS